jgi:beta-mannosidase
MSAAAEPAAHVPSSRPGRVTGHEVLELREGWQAARTAPGALTSPAGLDGLDWLPAQVPGTAASALRAAGAWQPGDDVDLDAEDWWFRTRFAVAPAEPGEELVLALDGIATVADVYLNGELVLRSASMFEAHRVGVGARLTGDDELAIRCRALTPLLAQPRRPRARWRTRIVADGNLRFWRTAVLGRAPGFAPGPAPVGPWRPVRVERRRGLVVDALELRPRLEGADGVLDVRALLRPLDGVAPDAVEVRAGGRVAELALSPGADGVEASGRLLVPGAAPWWPHTHGAPALHDVRLLVRRPEGALEVDAGRAGFRRLAAGAAPGHDVEVDGLDLHVNGTRVFARGAVWTPVDAVRLACAPEELRTALEAVRDAGMNLLRVPGIGVYEDEAFHDLCDELGLLVWQDLMFANLDYPVADDGFRALAEREVRAVLERVAGRPATAVLCGNSEVEQQVAMLGLDPALGRGELFGEIVPRLAAEARLDAVWVPSAPCGGVLPFRPGAGVANYFGVGAYRLPLDDARRAGVRFASECLAFANVPDDDAVAFAGVPRDVGADWDFADVRDHYLAELFGVDPGALRREDPERYLALARAVTGEVMAETFGEWRRAGSPCGGGLVLWLRDVLPGSGWGLLDHRGLPKAAYHHLRRALAPVAVWTTDERLGGVLVHAANDGPEPLRARVRVALHAGERRLEEAAEELTIAPHGSWERDAEAMLGRFADASWAYRFGPSAHDAVVVSLERDGELLSQAVRFPAGRPLQALPAGELGLEGELRAAAGASAELVLRSRRLAYGVRVHVPGFVPADDALCVEPGTARRIALRPDGGTGVPRGGTLTAINLAGRVAIGAA